MTKRQAETAAKKLLKMMKGEGWEMCVWENLGWHYSVQNNPREDIWITVYPACSKEWSAMIGIHQGSGVGRGVYADDPNDAVRRVIHKAKDFGVRCLQWAIDAEMFLNFGPCLRIKD